MTVLFHDVHKEDIVHTAGQRIEGMEADEVLYADDTICIAQTDAAMNRLLATIESEGARVGLRLNKSKCEYMPFGAAGRVHFSDGKNLKPAKEVKYLGCFLNTRADPALELRRRVSEAMIVMNRMTMFFRHSDNTIGQMYQ
eukprot:11715626-Alexandrium_andersonii.AAC.1